MANVNVTLSKTLDGAQSADALEGTATGLDFGQVANGSYAPVTSQNDNQGHHDIYVHHDSTVDPTTGNKIYIAQFNTNITETYGGARTEADDFTAISALGTASGSIKNNDGNSGGIWMESNASILRAMNSTPGNSGFDHATRSSQVYIFGLDRDPGAGVIDGLSNAGGFALPTQAMVYDNTGETDASAPQEGVIASKTSVVAGETAAELGDNSHIGLRTYLTSGFQQGGVYQWEFVFAYEFTA